MYGLASVQVDPDTRKPTLEEPTDVKLIPYGY
jgi:hypothetical protein